MKGKTLGILFVAALVLGGLGYLAGQREDARFTESKLGMGSPVLDKFDPNAVATIRISASTNHLAVARKNDLWVVADRGDFPANFGTISDFLRKLADLKVSRPVEVGASRYAALDLVDPAKGAGVRVELLGADGKTIRSLLLGKKHMRGGEDNSPMGGGGFPDGRYLLVEGDARSVALVSDALAAAEPRADEWLNKDFVKIELPRDIEVIRAEATNSFHLSRTNEFAEWVLVDAKDGEKVDTAKTGQFSTVFNASTINDVIASPDVAALGLDKPATAKVVTTTGFTYAFKFGKPQANEDYPVQIAVSALFPEPAKDEKPEDKEKRSKLQEKLKTEQAFSKYTFLMSKWTVDALLKNRGDLMVSAKPEAGKPAEGDSPLGLPPGLKIPGLPGN